MKLLRRNIATRTIFFVALDIVSIALAIWLAFLLRFDGNIPFQYGNFMLLMMLWAVVFTLPVFYINNLYSFSWAYVSITEVVWVFISLTISFCLVALTVFTSRHFPYFIDFPRSIIFMSFILAFFLCVASRLSKKAYATLVWQRGGEKGRTLIVGAGDAGEQILRNIRAQDKGAYVPFGFVDDNPLKQGIKIHGVKVLGKIADIPQVVRRYQISQMVIALPSAGSKTIRQAVELGKKAGLYRIKVTPPLHEVMSGQVALKNLRDVDVEDLLGRDRVELDKKIIEHCIKGKSVMVTGAAGSIGSELCRQIAKFNPVSLALLDQDETGIFTIEKELRLNFPGLTIVPVIADITNRARLDAVFLQVRPHIVFHAAAYKHVPLMEENSVEAVNNNVFGLKNTADASIAFGVEKFIFISTDKAINPTSVMGATKRIGEMICEAYSRGSATKFISVRFGNVLNSRGSVIPIFKEQIRRGGPVEVTHPDMQRYFMLISEACLLVMMAGAMGQGGEVFVLNMGDPVKIVDLAREMIKLSGLVPDQDIAIVFTGMRPGEKLFEEILTADEGVVSTQHQNIFTANLSQSNLLKLQRKLEELKESMASQDSRKVVQSLRDFVPFHAE